MIAPGSKLHGITTPAIKGSYDVIAALELMLKGTDLVVGRSPEGVVTISPRESKKQQEEREGMLKDTKNSVSLFALLLGALASAPAAAQGTSDTGAMETVTVTGFRASLASALAQKQNANLMLETVTAEDIGKMPDKDVAESLQRLPGVQIDRASGEGTQVRIRGLEYNVTLLDDDLFVTGREMYQTGEASGGGNGNTFHNSLEGIPSELITGVDVYKSPNAALVAGGLGGTINLHTRNALDSSEDFVLGGHASANYGQGAKRVTPAGAILASWKVTDKFGVVASLSYDDHMVMERELQAQNRAGWAVAGPTTGIDNTVGKDYIESELMYLTKRDIDRKRLGAFLGLDWNIDSAWSARAVLFHTFLTTDSRDVSNKLWFHSNNEELGPDPAMPFTVDSNGVIQTGTFRSKSTETSALVEKDKNIGDNIQAELNYDNGGKFRAFAKFAWGRGKMDSQFAQVDMRASGYGIDGSNTIPGTPVHGYAVDNCGGNGGYTDPTLCTFTYDNNNGLYPVVTYADTINGVSPMMDSFLFKSHWGWGINSTNDQWSGKAKVEYDLMDRVMLTTGIRYATKNVNYEFGRYLFNAYGDGNCSFDGSYTVGSTTYTAVKGQPCVNGQGQLSWETDQAVRGPWTYYQDPGLPNVPVQTSISNPERVKTYEDFFPAAGIDTIKAQDTAQMADCPSCWLQGINPSLPFQFFRDAINSFKVSSKVWSGFFMVDIGGRSDDFHVNTGVRVVHTELTITKNSLEGIANPVYSGTATWNSLPSEWNTVKESRIYTDILPSLNASWDFAEGHKLRFSAARVMAEQNFWNMGQGTQYYYTRTSCPDGRHNVATGGCDGFKFDNGSTGNTALEPYRANQVDLAYEYYFGTQGLISVGLFWKGVDSFVHTVNNSATINDDFGGTPGNITTYENGAGGSIQGIELSAQYAFDNGIGFAANYTYAKSKTSDSTDFSTKLPFPGVAANAYTAVVYYETGGFQGRLSYTWKGSSYYTNFPVIAYANQSKKNFGIYNRSYGQMDGQLSYDLWDNFGVVFEARNILGNATGRYLQYKNQPMWYDQSGRSYALGVKFSY